MRLAATALGMLIFFGLGAFALLQSGVFGAKPVPIAEKAKTVVVEASGEGLEKTADYWLSASKSRHPGDNRGSGTALAVAIKIGRLEALRSGTKPVPDRLERTFRDHYPDEVLDEARWTVAEPGSRLGRVLARWPVQEGAVTLGNVIVFKTDAASRNVRLLAHELVHVDQFRKMGVDEFARRYAKNPEPIEEEARIKARRVVRS